MFGWWLVSICSRHGSMASQPTGEEVLKQSAILGFLIVEGVGVRSRQTVFQSTTSFVTLRVSRQSLGVLSQSAPTKLRSHVLHYLHFSDRESRTMPTEGRLPSTAYTTDLTPPHVGRALERRPVTVDLEEHRNGSPGEPRVRQPRSNHTPGRSHQILDAPSSASAGRSSAPVARVPSWTASPAAWWGSGMEPRCRLAIDEFAG